MAGFQPAAAMKKGDYALDNIRDRFDPVAARDD